MTPPARTAGGAGSVPAVLHELAAFGLRIRSDLPLAGSRPARRGSPATPTMPTTTIARLAPEGLAAAWSGPGERIFEPEFPDGRVRFTVDRGDRHYRLWLEDFGRYLVSLDGTWIGCESAGVARDVQERFIFAQALPIAAVLHGYEVLHASAVHGPAGAAAFLGPPGSGKSAVATRLVVRGAGFLTDDVLALDLRHTPPLAHPGPPFMALRASEAGMVGDAPDRLGPQIGSSDKLHVARATPPGPLPLRSVYHLARGADRVIVPLDDRSRHLTLGHAFVPYVSTPTRLAGHLQAAAAMSRHVDQFRLQTPAAGLDQHALGMIEEHLRARGTG